MFNIERFQETPLKRARLRPSKKGIRKISKQSDFCELKNLKLVKELIQHIKDNTSDYELYAKARDVLAQIDDMDGTKPPDTTLDQFIY